LLIALIPKKKKINLKNCREFYFHWYFCYLSFFEKILKIYFAIFLTENAEYTKLETCFRLRFVSVANIYSLTDQTMRAIAGLTQGIVALDIRGCWRITDRGVACVAEYCPNIKVLNITDCRY
jgi:hypothetical protein